MRRRQAAIVIAAVALASCDDSPRGWRVIDDEVDGHLLSVWCGENDTLLAGGRGGRGTVFQADECTWQTMSGTGPALLRWIWGGGSEGAVAVGEYGTVLRLEEGRWAAQFSTLGTDVTLWGVWGSASDDVWAVGSSPDGSMRGILMHWDGANWIPFADAKYDVDLFKVWGCARDRVWIVGDAGTILAFDGENWAAEAAGTEAKLFTVFGAADCSRVWAVGLATETGRGVVLERSAGEWRVVRDDLSRGLFGVCGDAEETWVVGERGYAARLTDDGLEEDEAPTDLDLHACFRGPDCGTWAVGGDLSGTGADPVGIVVHRGSGAVRGPVDRMSADGGVVPDGPTGNGDIGPGQECPTGATASCQPGLQCWYVMDARRFVCTRDCEDVAFCDTEGFPVGCCAPPGAQTSATVCLPQSYGVCP